MMDKSNKKYVGKYLVLMMLTDNSKNPYHDTDNGEISIHLKGQSKSLQGRKNYEDLSKAKTVYASIKSEKDVEKFINN